LQTENGELKRSKDELGKELKKAQDNESFERNSVLHLTKDFNKLQVSFTGMVDTRGFLHHNLNSYLHLLIVKLFLNLGENMKLLALVKSYEKQISELIKVCV
jgi:hypothetical protein